MWEYVPNLTARQVTLMILTGIVSLQVGIIEPCSRVTLLPGWPTYNVPDICALHAEKLSMRKRCPVHDKRLEPKSKQLCVQWSGRHMQRQLY